MKRGELWWASLPEPTGSAPGYRRPVVVIQSNAFTASAIATVVVAVVTSILSLETAPGNVRLSKHDAGLARPSVVNVSQVLTVDKAVLTSRIKPFEPTIVSRIDQGLKLSLGL